MKNFLICCAALLLATVTGSAQDTDERAKAYFFSAEEQYEMKKYEKAIDYCQQAEKILGKSNAMLEALKMKSYYQNGEMQNAKKALNAYLSFRPGEELSKQVAPFIVKIEEAERARKEKEAAAEKERIRKEKEAEEKRIQQEKQIRERREKLLANALFQEGLGLVQDLSNMKFGYINASGDEVIPFEYEVALPFSNGLAKVKKNGKYGFIDKTGEEVIAIEYASLGSGFDVNGWTEFTQKANEYQWPWKAGIMNMDGEIIQSMKTKEQPAQHSFIHYWCGHYAMEDKKYEVAKELYSKIPASSEYYKKARLGMADIYYDGLGNTEQSYEKAMECYSFVDRTDLDTKQKLKIGDMYYNGYGTAEDKEKALSFYENRDFSKYSLTEISMKYITTAAELGKFPHALHHLETAKSRMHKKWKNKYEAEKIHYAYGYIYECKKDYANARKYYKKAAKFTSDYYGKAAMNRMANMATQ